MAAIWQPAGAPSYAAGLADVAAPLTSVGSIRLVGGITAMALMAFFASKVEMTPLWALGILVPILGTVGIVRVCWRWATVLVEGFNPYDEIVPQHARQSSASIGSVDVAGQFERSSAPSEARRAVDRAPFCSECGTRAKGDARFCRQCGALLGHRE